MASFFLRHPTGDDGAIRGLVPRVCGSARGGCGSTASGTGCLLLTAIFLVRFLAGLGSLRLRRRLLLGAILTLVAGLLTRLILLIFRILAAVMLGLIR